MKTDHDFATPQPEPQSKASEVDAADWEAMGKALRELHRVLLGVARRRFELDRGPIASPGHFLQLLTTDEYFAWLRPLSKLMADVDHIGGLDAISRGEVEKAVRAAVEGLIAPAEQEVAEAFGAMYLPLLADQPEVVMAHAKVRQSARKWPVAEKTDAVSHLRHREHVAEVARRPVVRRPKN